MAINKIQAGAQPLITLTAAALYPATPNSGDPIIFGKGKPYVLPAVALTDEFTDGTVTGDIGPSIFDLPVEAINAGGNSAVVAWDAIFYESGGDPPLNKKVAGIFFGWALETVVAGETTTIKVLIGANVPYVSS